MCATAGISGAKHYLVGLKICLDGERTNHHFLALLFRDLRALLKLLTHLTQRDLIDFGSTEDDSGAGQANGAGPAVDVAQLVFLGLDILIPLISLELLGYPKLCLLYFQLLAYMMKVSLYLYRSHNSHRANLIKLSPAHCRETSNCTCLTPI